MGTEHGYDDGEGAWGWGIEMGHRNGDGEEIWAWG